MFAPPQDKGCQQRQVSQRVGEEGTLGASRQYNHAAHGRTETARDVVADRAERDGGRQMLRLDLLTDGCAPGGAIQGDTCSNE
jgi:hypothetical protein